MASVKSAKKTSTGKRAGRRTPGGSVPDKQGYSIPERLFANVSPHSVGGMSLFDYDGPMDESVVANFMSDEDLIYRAAQALRDAGFDVLQLTPYTINVAAPIATFEQAFKTKIVPHELPTLKGGGVQDTATYFSASDPDHFGLVGTRGTAFEKLLEGVAIETPRYYFAPQPLPPTRSYWHLDVPAGVSLGCNADRAHRSGITGRGIRVAMVDSGHYAHPYFASRGYRVRAVTLAPGAVNAAADENGHGTAESANIFANAPDCELHPVKMSFANTLAAFNAAVALAPDIITCSWGSSVQTPPPSAADQALAAAISDAVGRGITVIFSAGNGHHGFPGQHPDVIAAGGVYRGPDGALRASDYASGFASQVYPGRKVPDLCGLVGMRPRASYLMLPLQPGSTIDTELAVGGAHPASDETAGDDGWAAISGTSAAAPQLAGAAALVKQACPRLTPAEVRDILVRTAIDVTVGNCNPASGGAAAAPGPDLATGAGLVDAHAAVLVAKLRCAGPVPPIRPGTQAQSVLYVDPPPRIRPIGGAATLSLKRPPIRPRIRPGGPRIRPPTAVVQDLSAEESASFAQEADEPTFYAAVMPVRPRIRPIGPAPRDEAAGDPAGFAEPAADATPPAAAPGSLSADDVQSLEDLVIQRKFDPLA